MHSYRPDITSIERAKQRAANRRLARTDRFDILKNTCALAIKGPKYHYGMRKVLAKWVLHVINRETLTDPATRQKIHDFASALVDHEHMNSPGADDAMFLQWVHAALQRPGVKSTLDQHLPPAPLKFFGEEGQTPKGAEAEALLSRNSGNPFAFAELMGEVADG